MARTKIVATLGPATSSLSMIRKLVEAGADVFRLNFSHGTHEEHSAFIRNIRRVSREKKVHLGIIADLSGPKIRCGIIEPEPLLLKRNENVVVVAEDYRASSKRNVIPINYRNLAKEVKPGERIMLADGDIGLRVKKVEKERIICKVINGGFLTSRKGVNLPDTNLRLSALTDKDKEDTRFCLEEGVDFFALSFVRKADDIRKLKRFIRDIKKDDTLLPIIAKIEKSEALSNIREIVAESYGIMVARGDLGVEVPLYKVPLIQKEIIRVSNEQGKPVITATQMLESMLSSPRPTRAEVADIANAIFDGSDAIMLSGETAVGNYPYEAVAFMNRVAEVTEEDIEYGKSLSSMSLTESESIPDAISHATCVISHNLRLDAILCLTMSGMTARMVARYRPCAPILGFSSSESTLRQLQLSWGVVPVKLKKLSSRTSFEKAVERSVEVALKENLIKKNQRVVITAGLPLLTPGTTDTLCVIKI